MQKKRPLNWNILITLGPLLAFTSQLGFYTLFPVNNIQLSWIGAANYGLGYLIQGNGGIFTISSVMLTLTLILALAVFACLIIKKTIEKSAAMTAVMFIFFILSAIPAYAVIFYTSSKWHEGEHAQLGEWINHNIQPDAKILIDMQDKGEYNNFGLTGLYIEFPDGSFVEGFGFYANAEISVGNPENGEGYDYILSTDLLEYKIVHQTADGINLYKT